MKLFLKIFLDDDNGESSGSVYVFQYDGDWFQLQKIAAEAGLSSDQFGLGLAMDGDGFVGVTDLLQLLGV